MKINTNKPYKIYADYVEHAALNQFELAMSQDFVLQGVLLPDTHAGYTLPIGCVVLTKDCIVPAYVGYDIGCSVLGAKLDLTFDEIDGKLEEIKQRLLAKIPLGNNKHHKNVPIVPKALVESFTKVGKHLLPTRAAGQLGTLGSGNHFFEIGVDESDVVWIIIHSGSRGLGHGIASHYMKVAANASGVTSGNYEGHFPLVRGTKDYDDYVKDQNGALEFARLNRSIMCGFGMQAISEVIGKPVVSVGEMINHNHNHATINADGTVTHRKGAVQAEKGMLGCIPMNMKDGTYIVCGLGNPDSLQSSSHGAGRKLSRSKAKELLSVDEFKEMMEGVVTNISDKTIDESPLAYKSPEEVMGNQTDLIEIIAKVRPVLNIKG